MGATTVKTTTTPVAPVPVVSSSVWNDWTSSAAPAPVVSTSVAPAPVVSSSVWNDWTSSAAPAPVASTPAALVSSYSPTSAAPVATYTGAASNNKPAVALLGGLVALVALA